MAKFDRDRFLAAPIVAILRGFEADVVAELTRATLRGGLTTIEVTMNSPDVERSFEVIREIGGDDINVGAGTVCSLEDLDRALAAGAGFIVTPVLELDVVAACKERGVPVMPGAFTPTEVFTAWKAGADYVKLFPANVLGPGFIKDIRGPLPQVPILPTGGVDASTLGDFYAAGARAFGVGGCLYRKDAIARRDWATIEAEARRLVEAWRAASGE